jgi:hypothetical protein
MRCQCCGSAYDRGHFFCCKTPRGMRSEVWLGRHCKVCGKCPHHCGCEREAAVVAVDGWTHVAHARPQEMV